MKQPKQINMITHLEIRDGDTTIKVNAQRYYVGVYWATYVNGQLVQRTHRSVKASNRCMRDMIRTAEKRGAAYETTEMDVWECGVNPPDPVKETVREAVAG